MLLCRGGTQLLGLHLETQAIYVDEAGVCVSFDFTHTHRQALTSPPLLPSALPPLSSNIPNYPFLHPPTLSHPLSSSPALQVLNLALIFQSLKPSPSPTFFTHCLSLLYLSLSPSLALFTPLRRSHPLGLCTAARLMRGRISLPVL